jgi:nicotinamide phosphoribosyltransferase
MFGPEAAAMSGFAHLAGGSCGTDTITSVLFAEKFYGANVDTELVGASVDATEHSVTCNWEEEGEEAFLNYLLEFVTVTGILSFVSDTWDFWEFVNVILRGMKDKIMSREGMFVVRPDSGDPVKILTGYLHSGRVYESALMTGGYTENNMEVVNIQGTFYRYDYNDRVDYRRVDMDSPISEVEVKGLVQLLWEIFGGTETELGYKMLDSHIGCIYGDSITLERQREIYQRLMDKGFAPEPVLGVGSYSYQYVTRDTHGSAIKATSIVKRGVVTGIAKEPKTDSSKKSARGLLRVERVDGTLVMYDQQTPEEEAQGLLEVVFEDGVLLKDPTLQEIRGRVLEQIV